MPPKKKDPVPFPCMFCKPKVRKMHAAKGYSSHTRDEHNLEGYVLHPIRAYDKECRIMIPMVSTCIFPGCEKTFSVPVSDKTLGAHLRQQHNKADMAFLERMSRGDFFWWSTGEQIESELTSSAFSDPFKEEQARQAINAPESEIDPNDNEIEEDRAREKELNAYEGETVEDYVEAYSQTNQLNWESAPPDEVVEMRDESASSTRPCPVEADLYLPESLSEFGFGVLSLVDFSSQPNVIVCIRCKCFVGGNDRACKDHFRKKHKGKKSNEPDLEAVGLGQVDSEPEEMQPEGVLDDIDQEMNPVESDKEDVVKKKKMDYKSLNKWFREPTLTIQLSMPSPPGSLVPAISFFNLVKGHRCPFDRCFFASPNERSVFEHINRSHMNDDEGGSPIPCHIQTLNEHDIKVPYFPVEKTEQEVAPEELMKQEALKILTENTRDTAPMEGLPYSNLFMRKFRFQSIFPPEYGSYNAHVARYIVRSTIIHSSQQTPAEQLLALGCLFYMMDGVDKIMQSTYHNQRLLALKIRHEQIGTEAVTTSFQRHSSRKSTIGYSALYSSFLVYVLRCATDQNLDKDLKLQEEHVRAARALNEKLDRVCKQGDLVPLLAKIQRYPHERFYSGQTDVSYPSRLVEAADSLSDLIHQLSFSLISLPLHLPSHANELELPVSRFFAWKSWDPYSHVFRTPNVLHTLFIQLQFGMRVSTFYEWQLRADGMEEGRAEKLFATMHDIYLLQDTTSPFGCLQNYIRYSGIIASSIAHAPTTTWVEETNGVSINGATVNLEQFISMVGSCIKEATSLFDKEILFGERERICGVEKGYIKRSEVIFDLAYSNLDGYSYINANPCFSTLKKKLGSFIVDNLLHRFHHPFLLRNNTSAWNHQEIRKWLGEVDKFNLYLAACVYWASGQPCRMPELLSVLTENVPGRERHLYAIQGSLMIIQTYSKSLSVTQRPGLNIRMPAYQLQELIEAHLSIVHPIYVVFHKLLGTESVSSSHLFTQDGRPMQPEELSKFIQGLSQQHVQFAWGVKIWRQWMISLSQLCMPSDVLSLPFATTVIAAQASHSQQTVNLNYDQREEYSAKFISTQITQQFRMISLAWLELIGLAHPKLTAKNELTLLVGPSAREQLKMTTTIEDMSVRVLQRVLQQERTSTISFLENAVQKMAIHENVDRIPSTYTVPLKVAVQRSTFQLLQQLYPGASFRSNEQAQCIQHCMDNTGRSLLAILPMGHGKSLIYQLPVLAERPYKKITLVIVPLISLAQAACKSAERAGITAHFLNPSDPKAEDDLDNLDMEILFTTYDLLVKSTKFQIWTLKKANSGVMPRIVVDEAHTIASELRFRHNFTQLPSTLMKHPIPKVFLTGTLPAPVEAKLMDYFRGMGPISSVRRTTDIPNLAYHVSDLKGTNKNIDAILDRFQTEVYSKLEENPTHRAIIYVQSVPWGREIANRLGSGLFMNPIELIEKQADLNQWLDEKDRNIQKHVMVATSSFALGVDYPYCHDVIFIGDPFGGVINFTQMAARAGRDQQPAKILLYPSSSPKPQLLPGQELEAWEIQSRKDWEEFKSTKGCRRTPLARNLDDSIVTCFSLPNAVLCDRCRDPNDHKTSSIRSINPEVAAGAVAVMERRRQNLCRALYDFVATMKGSCIYCHLQRLDANHEPDQCERQLHKHRDEVRKALALRRKMKHVDKFVACPGCHLPQHRSIRGAMDAHMPFHGGEDKECDLKTFVVDLIIGLENAPRLMEPMQTKITSPLYDWLLTPIIDAPSSSIDPEEQMLRLHFIIPALAFLSPNPPSTVKSLGQQDWFQDWLVMPITETFTAPALNSFTQERRQRDRQMFKFSM